MLRYTLPGCMLIMLTMINAHLLQADEHGVSSSPVQADHVLATLGSPVQQAAPGERIPLILSLTAEDSWHLYWSNPGDSGMPPRVTLDLPEGVSQDGSWQLPPPRHLIAGGMGTLVLDHDVILLTYLEISEDFDGETLSISLNAQWLVCDDHMCLPGNAALELDIPVGSASQADAGPWYERLHSAQQVAAQNLDEQPELSYADGSISLSIPEAVAQAGSTVIVAPARNRIINLGAAQTFEKQDNGATLRIGTAFREAPKELNGLLVALDADGFPVASWQLASPFPQP